MMSVAAVAGSVSDSSCFRYGFVVERELVQHGAPAALVDEVCPRLVVVFPDGGYDGCDSPADLSAAGYAGTPYSVLADGHGLAFLLRMLGNS